MGLIGVIIFNWPTATHILQVLCSVPEQAAMGVVQMHRGDVCMGACAGTPRAVLTALDICLSINHPIPPIRFINESSFSVWPLFLLLRNRFLILIVNHDCNTE